MSTIDYHLRELEVARDRDNPRHCIPDIAPHERDVLDIGCGIGQLFVALDRTGNDGLSAGVDLDQEALAYGAQAYPHLRLLRARAEALPFPADSFDLVVSRVCLPYTDLPRAIGEIARVARPGARVWFSLHPLAMTWRELAAAVRETRIKDVVYRSYILFNGVLFHCLGRIVPFPGSGRRESFQTARGMRRLLAASGFEDVRITRDRHFVVQARLQAASPR